MCSLPAEEFVVLLWGEYLFEFCCELQYPLVYLLARGVRVAHTSMLKVQTIQCIAYEAIGDIQIAYQHLGLFHSDLFGCTSWHIGLSQRYRGT